MNLTHIFQSFPKNYRLKEREYLLARLVTGKSASVVGFVGCGRTNFLDFLCHRTDWIAADQLPKDKSICLIPVDLNTLPVTDISMLYRVILRSIYWMRERFDPALQNAHITIYKESYTAQDPFINQSALYEALLLFYQQDIQVVLVLNRFDRFYQNATQKQMNTLRALRDSFKDILCFVVGMRLPVTYLSTPESLGDMYELVDSHTCWIGTMNQEDARWVIDQNISVREAKPTDIEVNRLISLAGNFPVLLKAVAEWWSENRTQPQECWLETLVAEPHIRFRLERLWQALTQEEQAILTKIREYQDSSEEIRHIFQNELNRVVPNNAALLKKLASKGICYPDSGSTVWRIRGEMLAAYIEDVGHKSRGSIYVDQKTGMLHQGYVNLSAELRNQEEKLLRFLIQKPYREFSYQELTKHIWPEDAETGGRGPDSIQKLVSDLRKKVEIDSSDPCYIIHCQGLSRQRQEESNRLKDEPDGGYCLYPEGRPR